MRGKLSGESYEGEVIRGKLIICTIIDYTSCMMNIIAAPVNVPWKHYYGTKPTLNEIMELKIQQIFAHLPTSMKKYD